MVRTDQAREAIVSTDILTAPNRRVSATRVAVTAIEPERHTQDEPALVPDRPTGLVTFLFTDVEGSTKLWEKYPEAMQRALARHDAIVRHAITSNGGLVFKTIGDAFCAAFSHAPSALLAAVDAQRDLSEEPW